MTTPKVAYTPTPYMEYALERLRHGRILDLGCGAGKLALYLARLGYEVEALDNNAEALESLSNKAQTEGLNIKTIEGDLHTYDPGNQYDGVFAINSIHFAPQDVMLRTFERIKDMTALGGWNVISVWAVENKEHEGRTPMGHYGLFNRYLNDDWKLKMWHPMKSLTSGQIFAVIAAQKIAQDS